MEFKDFADILKTHINVDADDDEFFMEIFDNYLREPTDEELQKLEDAAKKKEKKTKKHVEPEPWNPFDGIGKDAQERLFRGQYLRRKGITKSELDNLERFAVPYLGMGGNGTGEKIWKDVKNLELITEAEAERRDTEYWRSIRCN